MSERDEIIHGLREFADFLEATPGAPAPDMVYHFTSPTPSEWAAVTAALAPCEKGVSSGYGGAAGDLILDRKFSGLTYSVRGSQRQICEQVQVGTRTETRSVPVGEVEYVDETVEVEVYEWKCPESFLALGKD